MRQRSAHKRWRLAWLLATAPWLTAFGPYRSATLGAASLGMADAQVATAVGVAALVANPANMAANQQQVLEFGAGRDSRGGHDGLHVGVVDASSSWGIAAGVAYQRDVDWTHTPGLRTGNDLRFGLALGGINEVGRLTIGASARWLTLDVPGAGKSRWLGGWTGDVGVAASIHRFRLGGVVRHVLSPDAAETPRRLAFGIGWADSHLLANVEASLGLRNPTPLAGTRAADGLAVRAGAAYQIGDEGLQLRAGFAHDDSLDGVPALAQICAGLGWHTTTWAIDGSVGADVAGSGQWLAAVSLSWLMPQQSE
jgi:hypothetical protein